MVSTLRVFLEEFPDEDACLERIMVVRYGLQHTCRSCEREALFERIPGRRAYACTLCGAVLYPCVGTIFERSQTSLRLWFYALYLFSTRRNGVSSKELQRDLCVTYKTAWRMSQQIRLLMQRVNDTLPSAELNDRSGRRSRGIYDVRKRASSSAARTALASDDESSFRRQALKIYGHFSPKYASRYYAEFAFRSKHQGPQNAMFERLIESL